MSHDELAGSAKAPPVIDFAGLYRAHAGEVRRFALYLSADPSLADDIVSETFIRLWSARERVVLPTVRAYLFAIARNLFLQQRQRAHRDVGLDEQVADGQPDPEEQTRSRAELRTVMSALQALPEPDRAAVLMRADDGMSYDEIARALGIRQFEPRAMHLHPGSDGSAGWGGSRVGRGVETMNVTRDVVRDLVTVYLAGEASADTRAFVEDYLRTDPDLAREVEAARAGDLGLAATPAPVPAAEKRALDATRQLLRNRTATLVVAIVFTVLPFTFVFKDSRITFLLIRDAPVIGGAWLATAAVMWIWHAVIRARLRMSGL